MGNHYQGMELSEKAGALERPRAGTDHNHLEGD